MSTKTLYERLGGYDAICAVVNDLLPRLQADSRLARFWQHRGDQVITFVQSTKRDIVEA
jgi:hemoglobin